MYFIDYKNKLSSPLFEDNLDLSIKEFKVSIQNHRRNHSLIYSVILRQSYSIFPAQFPYELFLSLNAIQHYQNDTPDNYYLYQ